MGQKVNPLSFRLGSSAEWNVRWFGRKDYAKLLTEDIKVREYLEKRLDRSSIGGIHLERSKNTLTITIQAARPGVVIGRGGAGIEAIRKALGKLTTSKLQINIEEVHQPDLNARVVAETIATQLEKRIAFRRAIRQAVDRVMKSGAKGVKVAVAGRLGGAEMSRTEVSHQGKVPLHTIRAGIDYGYVKARTTYGTIGVKVWIYTGEVGEYAERDAAEQENPYSMKPGQTRDRKPGGTDARA
jgi:small subunit ribosomal protein S3